MAGAGWEAGKATPAQIAQARADAQARRKRMEEGGGFEGPGFPSVGRRNPGFFGGAGGLYGAGDAPIGPGTGPVIGGAGGLYGGLYGGGGGGGGGWIAGPVGGGGGGLPSAPAMPELDIYANPSPQMQEAIAAWKKRMGALETKANAPDPNLQWQTEEYKRRMSEDPTKRAIEKAASAIRDQAAGMGGAADVVGAATGRGEGMGAAGIGDAAQAALARSASDIALAREKQLDQLLLGGQAIMGAPGEREAGYEQLLSSTYNVNPMLETSRLGLEQQNLSLQAYLGQLDAQARAAEAQARIYGSPMDWYRMLLE